MVNGPRQAALRVLPDDQRERLPQRSLSIHGGSATHPGVADSVEKGTTKVEEAGRGGSKCEAGGLEG
jgi:hypothetical protein